MMVQNMGYKLMEKKPRHYIQKLIAMLFQGDPVSKKNELKKIDKEENYENLVLARKAIDYVKDYTFDKNNSGCLLIFKKIKDVCISKKKI
jgi:hypothetical protein